MGLKEITSIYQTISISVRLLTRESEKEQVYDILELLRKSITECNMKFWETCIPTNVHGYKTWHKKSFSRLPFVKLDANLLIGQVLQNYTKEIL